MLPYQICVWLICCTVCFIQSFHDAVRDSIRHTHVHSGDNFAHQQSLRVDMQQDLLLADRDQKSETHEYGLRQRVGSVKTNYT
jgi:hypothetical protein